MANLNKVMLIGRLTRDPETKFTASGMAIAKMGLAVGRKYKDKSGNYSEETTFIDCTAFGKQAETINQYLSKGSGIYLEGRLNLESWEDKNTGAKRSKLGVVLESFQFMESAKQSDSQPRREAAPPRTTAEEGKPATNYDEDEDVPF